MRALSINLLTSLLIQILGIASGVLVARLLGPAGRGELAAIYLWPSIIAALGMISLNESIVYAAAARTMAIRRLLSSGFALASALAPAWMILGALLLPYLYSNQRPEVLVTAYIYLAFIPLNFLTLFPVAMFQGTMRVYQWNAMRALVHVSYVIGILVLWSADLVTVRTLAITMLFANAVNLLLAVLLFWRLKWRPQWPKWNDLKVLLRYAFKIHLGFVSRFLGQWLDQAIISIVLLAIDLGLYVVAVTIARGILMISTTVETVAFPRLAAEDAHERQSEILGRFMKAMIVLVALGALALFLLTTVILEFLFGPAFLPAAPIAYILIIANIVLSANLLFVSAFKGYGQPLLASRLEAIGVVVLAIAMAILLPAYGTIGVAVSVLVAQTTTCVLLAVSARRNLGVSLRHTFIPTINDAVWAANKLRRRA